MGEIVIDNDKIANRLNEDTTELQYKNQHVEKAPENWAEVHNQIHDQIIPAEVKLQIEEQPKVTKTRNRVQKATTSGKSTSVQESIAKLQEKVVMLQYVDSIKVPDVPTELSKHGREVLLNIGKELDSLKNRMISAIQKS